MAVLRKYVLQVCKDSFESSELQRERCTRPTIHKVMAGMELANPASCCLLLIHSQSKCCCRYRFSRVVSGARHGKCIGAGGGSGSPGRAIATATAAAFAAAAAATGQAAQGRQHYQHAQHRLPTAPPRRYPKEHQQRKDCPAACSDPSALAPRSGMSQCCRSRRRRACGKRSGSAVCCSAKRHRLAAAACGCIRCVGSAGRGCQGTSQRNYPRIPSARTYRDGRYPGCPRFTAAGLVAASAYAVPPDGMLAVAHPFTTFATLSDPRPVALSYPTPAE